MASNRVSRLVGTLMNGSADRGPLYDSTTANRGSVRLRAPAKLSAAIRLSATHPLLRLQGRGALQLPIVPMTAIRTPLSPECAGTLARWSSKVLRCRLSSSEQELLRLGGAVPVRLGVSHGTSKPQTPLAEREISHKLREPGPVVDVRSDECVETLPQPGIMPLREILPKFRRFASQNWHVPTRRNSATTTPLEGSQPTGSTKALCAALFLSNSARMNSGRPIGVPKINMP